MELNYWTNLSIQYANQRNYLDDLFCVYPTIPNGIREIDGQRWSNIEQAFNEKDNEILIKYLLNLDLFPIKDSYVAFLKRDPTAVKRNPKTIARLCGRLYEMGLDKIWEKCTEPKETNRQIGPLFKKWCKSKALGISPVQIAILDGVVWLKSQNKMYKTVTEKYGDKNIMSALLLREFLYQI